MKRVALVLLGEEEPVVEAMGGPRLWHERLMSKLLYQQPTILRWQALGQSR